MNRSNQPTILSLTPNPLDVKFVSAEATQNESLRQESHIDVGDTF